MYENPTQTVAADTRL